MAATVKAIRDLERELLRKGLSALVAGRPECASCHRTPLVGERVHVYRRGATLCELCRQAIEDAPDHTEIVRSSEHGHAVRASTRIERAA